MRKKQDEKDEIKADSAELCKEIVDKMTEVMAKACKKMDEKKVSDGKCDLELLVETVKKMADVMNVTMTKTEKKEPQTLIKSKGPPSPGPH